LTLKVWGELSFEETAEVLKISPNTAASRVRYALEKLRRALGVEPTAADQERVTHAPNE
jgi:RNA polymerase sigma-70 factor (ECF subfamily)